MDISFCEFTLIIIIIALYFLFKLYGSKNVIQNSFF